MVVSWWIIAFFALIDLYSFTFTKNIQKYIATHSAVVHVSHRNTCKNTSLRIQEFMPYYPVIITTRHAHQSSFQHVFEMFFCQ